MNQTISHNQAQYPSPLFGWVLVSFLTFAYILSYTDRYIIYLLNTAIKADFGLTDSDMGLLMGPAFGILYATMGVPLGILADKARRLTIISVGVMVWSLATIACGIARNFAELFFARMIVGVGEACLSPCALSLISDSFPKEKRGLPIAVYFTALSIGGGLANLILPVILEFSKNYSRIPIIGEVTFWQLAFVIVGLPGILFALVVYFLREPSRKNDSSSPMDKSGHFQILKRFMNKEWKLMVTLFLMYGMMTIIAYAHSWLPALFETVHNWSREDFAKRNGIAILLLAPITSLYFGWLSDKLIAKKMINAPIKLSVVCFFIMCITNSAAGQFDNAWISFAMFQLTTLAVIGMTVLGPTAILFIIPSQIKGITIALYFMVISFTGLFLGPTTIGFVNDLVFNAEALHHSMTASTLAYFIPSIFIALYVFKNYTRLVNENN